MPYQIQAIKPDPILEYDVVDAATGMPMRHTAVGGVVALVPQQQGVFKVVSRNAPPSKDPIGLFLPGMHPVPMGLEPMLIAEVYLTSLGVYDGDLKATKMYGIGEVAAQVAPDQQRGGQRFVYLSFVCVGGEPMVVRYRVMMVRPRG